MKSGVVSVKDACNDVTAPTGKELNASNVYVTLANAEPTGKRVALSSRILNIRMSMSPGYVEETRLNCMLYLELLLRNILRI